MAGSKDWDPDDAIEALKMETTTFTSETSAKTSQRLLEENAPGAVLAIVHLARNSDNEKIRLEAAKYVTDRVLGRVQDAKPIGVDDPFKKVSEWLTEEEQETPTTP